MNALANYAKHTPSEFDWDCQVSSVFVKHHVFYFVFFCLLFLLCLSFLFVIVVIVGVAFLIVINLIVNVWQSYVNFTISDEELMIII